MEELKKDLDILKSYMGKVDEENNRNFEEQLYRMQKKYSYPQEKEIITKFVIDGLDEVKRDMERIEEQLRVMEEFKTISEIVSFSYIAKTYFNKTKSWFSQRINGNQVHGKVVRFTDKELDTLRFAVKDISKKLGSLSLS